MSSTSRRPFDFTANHLALDFVNTVNGRPAFTRDDLADIDDIFDWAIAAGIAPQGDHSGARVGDLSQLQSAVALRENLYKVFGPIAAGEAPRPAAMAFITRRAAQAMQASTWLRGVAGYEPHWPPQSIEGICDRVADEAVQLLRSAATVRVGQCAGCGWLFLDTSRGHARRWCSMNVCGVRDKMRRYHQRHALAASTL